MSKNFIKRKLSKEAIDAFVLKYTTQNNSDYAVKYTTISGEQVYFSPSKALVRIRRI